MNLMLAVRSRCSKRVGLVSVLGGLLLIVTYIIMSYDSPGHSEHGILQESLKFNSMVKNLVDFSRANVQHVDDQFLKSHSSRIVLIVAYLRTGSSFTASILEKHPGTFFVFEPLHQLEMIATQGGWLHYLNGTHRLWNGTHEGVDEQTLLEAVKFWLSCQFERLDKATLKDDFLSRHSRSIGPLMWCQKKISRLLPTTVEPLKRCVRPVQSTCVSAKFRLFKFIRIPMSIAEDLIKMFPNMKVIHLLRDPRGMFNSQIKASLASKLLSKFGVRVEKMCNRILQDLKSTGGLLRRTRGIVKPVLYEDIADSPLKMARNLYEFTGMTFTKTISEFVTLSTSRGMPDNGVFGTRRRNSSATASRWRGLLLKPYLDIIDAKCQKVYDVLGYTRLSFNDMRNLTVTSRKKVNVTENILQFTYN